MHEYTCNIDFMFGSSCDEHVGMLCFELCHVPEHVNLYMQSGSGPEWRWQILSSGGLGTVARCMVPLPLSLELFYGAHK